MPSSARKRSTAGAALCALTACTGMGSSAGDPLAGTGGRNEIRIVVQNGNFYDARLYALSDGMRRPLGSVGGNADGVFMMPLGSPRDIRLEISLLAGPTCVTYPVPVDPGDTLEVQIRPGPIESDFCR